MRLEEKREQEIKDPYDIELYFNIFTPHPYYPMIDRDFCCLCSHSKLWHMENVEPKIKKR
jgi:hypothetical protein